MLSIVLESLNFFLYVAQEKNTKIVVVNKHVKLKNNEVLELIKKIVHSTNLPYVNQNIDKMIKNT